MTSTVRLGLVGCGRLAERGWIPAIAASEDVSLAAVADPEPGRCADAAPGVAAYPSADELLAAGVVDAVVIASPAEHHVAHARLAAEAGLPTLVEKPPAPDAWAAEELTVIDPPPWIGFNRRFDPRLGVARDAARSAPHPSLELEIRYRRAAWDPHAVSDDVLLDLGPHLVDLARWLSGRDVEEIEAIESSPERARLRLALEDGASARIICALDRPYLERVEVSSRGARVARIVRGGYARNIAARLCPPDGGPLVPTLARELDAFVRAARGEEAGLLATAEDGLAAMRVIDAVRWASG